MRSDSLISFSQIRKTKRFSRSLKPQKCSTTLSMALRTVRNTARAQAKSRSWFWNHRSPFRRSLRHVHSSRMPPRTATIIQLQAPRVLHPRNHRLRRSRWPRRRSESRSRTPRHWHARMRTRRRRTFLPRMAASSARMVPQTQSRLRWCSPIPIIPPITIRILCDNPVTTTTSSSITNNSNRRSFTSQTMTRTRKASNRLTHSIRTVRGRLRCVLSSLSFCRSFFWFSDWLMCYC